MNIGIFVEVLDAKGKFAAVDVLSVILRKIGNPFTGG